MKMNKTKTGLVIMTAMLMLLTVTLLPVVNAEPLNEQTRNVNYHPLK